MNQDGAEGGGGDVALSQTSPSSQSPCLLLLLHKSGAKGGGCKGEDLGGGKVMNQDGARGGGGATLHCHKHHPRPRAYARSYTYTKVEQRGGGEEDGGGVK